MVAVPATQFMVFEFQDVQGFRATVKVDQGFDTDVSADPTVVSGAYAGINGVATAVANCSNAKLVGVTFGYRYGIAQEPTAETGQYRLVTQKAHLEGGDGKGSFQSMQVPAPKDAIFLTTGQDNMIVVNPAATQITALQTALAASGVNSSARGGALFSQFFGGQYRGERSRRRRVLQGA